jgi:hypothetical protein
MIRLAKCERAIRRLFREGASLPDHERHPFCDSMDVVLSQTVSVQERWVELTEAFLPVAIRRVKKLIKKGQSSLKPFCVQRRPP